MTALGLETLSATQLWIAAAAVLGIAELIAPGFFLIWIALAAFVTALATFALPLPFAAQCALFAVTAVASVFAGRWIVQRNPITSSDPALNDRAARMIGAIVTAVEAVDAVHGRVKVGDSVWSARGASAAAGERVRVIGVDGATLIVEAVEVVEAVRA